MQVKKETGKCQCNVSKLSKKDSLPKSKCLRFGWVDIEPGQDSGHGTLDSVGGGGENKDLVPGGEICQSFAG